MGARLFANEAGPPSATPVVLLHGFGGHASIWSPVIDSLPETVRTLAFDLPGHGRSLNFPGFGSPRVAANALLWELEMRGIEKAHIVGHSMGGAVAVLMALEKPEAIASLVLAAPGGFGPEMDQRALKAFAQAVHPADLSRAYGAMMADGFTPNPAMIRQLADMRSLPGQSEALLHTLSKISRGAGQGELPLDRLAEGQFPATLLWGEIDRTVPFPQAASAPRWFTRVNLPGKGHMLIDEAPQELAQCIASHVRNMPQTI